MSMPIPPEPPRPPRDLHDAQLVAGVSSKHSGLETSPCTRCGHSARWHSGSSSCSHRVRWWRRCGCSAYS